MFKKREMEVASEKLDNKTLENICNKYYETLSKVVYVILRDTEDTKDVVQNLFKDLPEKIINFKEGKFSSWLFKVAKNSALSYLRTRNKRIALPLSDQIPDDDSDGKKQFKISELSEMLSTIEYEAIVLHYRAGFSYKEITIIMDLTDYECRKLFKDAKQKIEKYYTETYLKSKIC